MTVEEIWKDIVRKTPIDDESVHELTRRMAGIENRSKTPKGTVTVLFEARAVIARQNGEIKALRKRLNEAQVEKGAEAEL